MRQSQFWESVTQASKIEPTVLYVLSDNLVPTRKCFMSLRRLFDNGESWNG